jgi:hypothetical protein
MHMRPISRRTVTNMPIRFHLLASAFLAGLFSTIHLHAEDEHLLYSSNPKDPKELAIVLSTSERAERASLWNPRKKLSISADAAVKKVFDSALVRKNPKNWVVRQLHLWACQESLWPDPQLPSPPSHQTTLITSYWVELQRISDGKLFPFKVLMNGTVYSPHFEEH